MWRGGCPGPPAAAALSCAEDSESGGSFRGKPLRVRKRLGSAGPTPCSPAREAPVRGQGPGVRGQGSAAASGAWLPNPLFLCVRHGGGGSCEDGCDPGPRAPQRPAAALRHRKAQSLGLQDPVFASRPLGVPSYLGTRSRGTQPVPCGCFPPCPLRSVCLEWPPPGRR